MWQVPPGEHWEGEEIHVSKSGPLHLPCFQTLVLSLGPGPSLTPRLHLLLPHPILRPLSPTPYAFSQTKAPTPAQSSPLSNDLLPHLGSQTSTSLLRDSHPESGRSYGEGLFKTKEHLAEASQACPSSCPHCHPIPPKLVYAPEVELKERLGMWRG